MNDNVVIVYNGEQVSVPKEVADFLEQDRKREQAQEKQDARHLSKSEFETVLSGLECVKRPAEDAVLRNLRLEICGSHCGTGCARSKPALPPIQRCADDG